MNSAAIRLDDENCHELRKAHKKLRYQTEFEPLFANRKTARFSSNSSSCRMLATSTMSAWRHGWARFRRSAARARTQRARRLRHRTSRGASQLRLEHSRESLEKARTSPLLLDLRDADHGRVAMVGRRRTSGARARMVRDNRNGLGCNVEEPVGTMSTLQVRSIERGHGLAWRPSTVAIQLSIGLRRGGELPDIAAIFIGVRQTAHTLDLHRGGIVRKRFPAGRCEILRRRARRTDGPPRYRPAFDTVPRREDLKASRAQNARAPLNNRLFTLSDGRIDLREPKRSAHDKRLALHWHCGHCGSDRITCNLIDFIGAPERI